MMVKHYVNVCWCIFQYRVTGKFQLLKARLITQWNHFPEIHEQKCYSRRSVASCPPRSDSVTRQVFSRPGNTSNVIISAAAILRLRPRELQFDLCDSHCSKWCLRVIHYACHSACCIMRALAHLNAFISQDVRSAFLKRYLYRFPYHPFAGNISGFSNIVSGFLKARPQSRIWRSRLKGLQGTSRGRYGEVKNPLDFPRDS